MPLSPGTYTPVNNAAPKVVPPVPQFMDIAISRENLLSGELVRRFDTKAFPKLGQTLSGTDAQGLPFPRVAIPSRDGVYN